MAARDPWLDYRVLDPPPPWGIRFGRPAAVAVCLVAAVGLGLLLMPRLETVREPSPRAECASNLHQIGLAILLFQGDHADHYPASLAEVLSTQQIGAQTMVCPKTNDTAAALPPSPTTQQAAAALAAPGHLSYVYCGHADWTDATVPADAVVMYEPPTNHGGDGCNILYGDFHVDWEPQPRAGRLIAAATATTRPVSAATVR